MNRFDQMVGKVRRALGHAPYVFECIISIIILFVILTEIILLGSEIMDAGFGVEGAMRLTHLMDTVLWLVIGLEFVRMLLEHSHRAVLEIMLFAIARQMIGTHTSMLENLLAVVAIAGIFVVRKYLYTKE